MTVNAWIPVGGAADGDDPANWSQGHFPLSTEDVAISGSDAITFTTNAALPCHNFDTQTFTGSFIHSGDFTVQIYGNICRIGAAFTYTAFFVLRAMSGANVTLTLNGNTTTTETLATSSDGGTWTFNDNGQINKIQLDSATAAIAWGARQITAYVPAGAEMGFDGVTAGAALTFSNGAKWTADGGAASYFDLNCDPSVVLPPIETNGLVQIYSSGMVNVQSYYQGASSAGIWLGDMTGDFDCVGDFTALSPLTSDGATEDQTGRVFNIGGNCLIDNTDLLGGEWNVTGDADYDDNGTITNTDFSGGSTLYAPNGVNGGGNSNVVFGPRPSGSNSGSATIGAGAGF